jgi:hypothetical protein
MAGFPYGKYKVKITATYGALFDHTAPEGYDLYLDAIRIYDPAQGNPKAEAVYEADNESFPTFKEIRDILIEQGSFDVADSVNGAVFMDGSEGEGSIADYEAFGPNNEVYLSSGQAIAFRLSDADYENIAAVHIGVKTPTGKESSVTISEFNGTSKTVTTHSATELYYDITDCITFNNDGVSNIIVISNNCDADTMVSLTNLKLTHKVSLTTDTSFVISSDDANKVLNLLY